jgi:4a-hydroxytetrahydrobiopterin dehydratase
MNTAAASRTRHCQPMEGQPPMAAADQVQAHLSLARGWVLRKSAIEKSWRFGNVHRTMAFVDGPAWIAGAEDHHPELSLGCNCCTVCFNIHSVGSIAINDFICAAEVGALMP